MSSRFEINKCNCGGAARLVKRYYETTEMRWIEEINYGRRDDGTAYRYATEVQRVVPSRITRHLVACPRCKKMSKEYGNKTRAVNDWNAREYNCQ